MTSSTVGEPRATRAPWLPLVIIVLAQLQMSINLSVLPVSLGPISEDLDVPATATASALLLYSVFVAALVMPGAKVGKLLGERRVFQAAVVVHGVAMVLMAVSRDATTMNAAQAIAGIAAGAGVPTFVVLIAANYHARQQRLPWGCLRASPRSPARSRSSSPGSSPRR
jgi:MFS family permease